MGAQLKLLHSLKSPTYPLCPVVHPPTFWKSILTEEPYRLKALWIVGSNPLATMTNPLMIEQALPLLEFIVVSEMFMTPTAQYADLILPAASWLEQDDVVNSLKQWCVIARRKVAQVGDVRDDREVMIELAHRLGLDFAFPWKDYQDFLAWMLEETGLSFEKFCEQGIIMGDMRYEKYKTDGFPTPSGKFELYFKLYRTWVLPLMAPKKTVAEFFAGESTLEQKQFYARRLNNKFIKRLGALYFGKKVMGVSIKIKLPLTFNPSGNDFIEESCKSKSPLTFNPFGNVSIPLLLKVK